MIRSGILPWAATLVVAAVASCRAASGPNGAPAGAVEHHRVASFDGVEIVYDDTHRGETTLAFVHGWACHRGHWSEARRAFRGEYRIITIDLGGHGESGTDRERWDLPTLARDVEAVLTDADVRDVTLVGHSMGGPVSLIASALTPERVVGVVGIDTLHDAEFEYPEGMLDNFASAMEADFVGTAQAMVRGMASSAQPEVIERLVREMESVDPTVGAALMTSFGELDVPKALSECPVPVRCINSTASQEVQIERNRKYAPDFDAVSMDGVSHFLMLDAPEEFADRLRATLSSMKR